MNKSFTLIELIIILFILSLMVDLSLSIKQLDNELSSRLRNGGELY